MSLFQTAYENLRQTDFSLTFLENKRIFAEGVQVYEILQHSYTPWGVFAVDGFGVFVYFDVGYSVISLKWCGILALENSAVNGF